MNEVCVIGSINMDISLQVESMPNEGESIYAVNSLQAYGGKGANAAVALSRLGISTAFYACVGKDHFGDLLLKNLQSYGIKTDDISRKDVPSGVAYIILESNGHNRIIVAPGANEAMTRRDVRTYCPAMIENADLVMIQLEIARECIDEVFLICKEKNKRLIVDAGPIRGINANALKGAFCVSPNHSELEALVGRKLITPAMIQTAARELLAQDIKQVVVKLGAQGCLYLDSENVIEVPAYPVRVVDTTAAGDSFMAGYCFALLNEMDRLSALQYASKCGAVAVSRMGACSSLPSLKDIENFQSFLDI